MLKATATSATVADWIGVSARRVKDLRAAGVLPGASGDPYDLQACVRAYCAHMRPVTGRAAAGGSEGAPTFDAARIRLLGEQADAQAMKNDLARGEVVLIRDVTEVVGRSLSNVRTRLLAIPSERAALLHRCKTAVETESLLSSIIHDTLTELSTPEEYNGTRGNTEARRRGGAKGPKCRSADPRVPKPKP
jgi:phage terminase Nu1 subunit (DNA packaging protein)